MKNKFYTILLFNFLFLASSINLMAQPGNTIIFEDSFSPIVATCEYVGEVNGRNNYRSNLGNTNDVDIKWSGTRWEVIGVSSGNAIHFSNYDVGPNPPDMATGNWQDLFGDELKQLSGTGTQVNTLGFVLSSTTACENNPTLEGLGGGTPAGGVYSGTGVTDDGNGMTFSFDQTAAGVGIHPISYGGGMTSITANIEVIATPIVTYSSPGTVNISDGIQTLSGGMPVGGTYSGPGVSETDFDPAAAGVGMHTITYSFTDANGCIGVAATDVITVIAPVTPGNECAEANDINNLFGKMLGEPQVSGLYDNTFYTSTMNDPTTGIDCFAQNDELQHTIWYTFVGDGNTYNIKTVNCNASNYIAEGDAQLAIYTGSCGNLNPVACNEDEDEATALYNVSLDFLTEPNVTYYALIDGYNSRKGEFCVQVTLSELTDVIDIEKTNIELFPNPTNGTLSLMKRIIKPGNSLNISDLSSGLYMLKIHAADKLYASKVVKQ